MSGTLSISQKKALSSIGWLVLLIILISELHYYVEEYTPDTYKYKLIWRSLSWALNTLVFGWYFYKNKKWLQGVLVQIAFVPFYVFKLDLYNWIDYNTTFDNSILIYKFIYGLGIFIPLLLFSILYGKSEKIINTLRERIAVFLISLLLFVVIYNGLDKIFELVRYVIFDPSYLKDIFYGIIILIETAKIISAFVAFIYISNFISSPKRFLNPVIKENISGSSFKKGFFISYTLIITCFLSLGSDVITIGVFNQSLEIMDIIVHIATLITLLVTSRAMGDFIQYRGYSLKRYLGVFNTLLLIPILNIIPFAFIILRKKSNQEIDAYLKKNKKSRPIHLLVFSVLSILYTVLNYEAEGSNKSLFLFVVLTLFATFILAYIKKVRRYLPLLTTAIYLFTTIKDNMDYYDLLPYLKEYYVGIIVFSIPSLLVVYYAFYYILHKSFYTHDSEINNKQVKLYIEEFSN